VQKNLRRMLAYSTIDQAGMMITALGIGGRLAAFALMLHMTFHTVAKSLLFLSSGNIYQCFKSDLFQKIRGGVLRVLPLSGAAFCLGTMAVAGMPPFSLFQSEFLMVRAAFGTGHFLVGALFVLFGVGVFTGITLHVSGMLLGPAELEPRGWFPWRDTPLVVLAVLLVVIGFWLPANLVELVRRAAQVVSG
jgi:hydrogenase-4 component F